MSGILFLGNDDFHLRQGDQGLLLTLASEIKGLTLVLFYSKECPYCDNLINKFKQLPNHINGCTFAMVNINRNMSVVDRSKSTVAPITYVPDLILFVNGAPYVRYDGAHDIQLIKEFIFNIYQKIQKTAFIESQSQNQTAAVGQSRYPPSQEGPQRGPGIKHAPPAANDPSNKTDHSNEIPAYTLGKPICGNSRKDGVCYLDFKKAYVNAN